MKSIFFTKVDASLSARQIYLFLKLQDCPLVPQSFALKNEKQNTGPSPLPGQTEMQNVALF